jgi:hypothetical protein
MKQKRANPLIAAQQDILVARTAGRFNIGNNFLFNWRNAL